MFRRFFKQDNSLSVMYRRKTSLAAVMVLMLISPSVWAECPDYKAKSAANTLSKAFLGKNSSVFQPAVVLKRHHPSRQKEVASYIKAGNQYYTMFSIVNGSCKAFFIKRAGPRY